ncbi:heme biosynthesis HemY N-terminal domain-containing protein [Thiohalorhabdus sp.]|uniref:heme biosynthesis HemY N-terminal domain-containing protein n=1 Tax=Thiohalorhabdus sp. TaxID=3094134 RepID=UPI002FC35037
MRLLLKILLVLAIAVAVVTLFGEGPGYVLVQVGEWTLETTATLGLIVLVLVWALGWEVWSLLITAWHMPGRLAGVRDRRRRRRSLELLERGLLALEGGDAGQAQRHLARGARLAQAPAAFHLEAARAAHLAGAKAKAEEYLDQAQQTVAGDDPAVTLLRAEIEMGAGRAEHALALLSDLENQDADNPRLLKRLLVLYRRVADWDALMRLLPRARKAGVVTPEEADSELTLARGRRMEEARLADEGEIVERLWKEAGRDERGDPRIAVPWVRYLLARDRVDDARKALEQGLGRSWGGELVDLYLALPEAQASPQELLRRLERWRNDHPRDPHLLTVLAQLAISAQFWGKADQYLAEAGAQSDLPPQILLRLAHLYQAREKPDQALTFCQRGLAALGGEQAPELPPPGPEASGYSVE